MKISLPLSRKTTKALPLKRIHFVWISRDLHEFALFTSTLCDLTQMVCEISLARSTCVIYFWLDFVSLLKFWNENQPDRLQIRFYLTESPSRSITRNGEDDDEALLTPKEMFAHNHDFVMSRMYSGRPNWSYLFNYWASLYLKSSVNVYSCGPKALNKDVMRICREYNQKGFNFKFLHEAFSS